MSIARPSRAPGRAASGSADRPASSAARRSGARPRPRPRRSTSRPTSSSSFVTTSPPSRIDQPPTMTAVGPDRRAGVAVRVEQVRTVRTEVPVALLPPHRGRVERRQQRDPRLRDRCLGEVIGQHEAGPAVEVDLDGPDSRERWRGSRARSIRSTSAGPPSVPGPNRASQRRTSSACASATGSSAIGAPSQRSSGVQRYWLLIHVPVGFARTIRPSTARRSRTRDARPISPS